ncbi:transcription termination/antitermination factor NusG [Leptotrichia sp. oral taxon 218]|uniref:transcription termination/antitermination protein NusG n=1 Tax=Leptotrichia sp. oral taxon 218 TaxID=712361 RepID=UPI001B8D00D6|nr:transcription termination/antitermination protein NusG [Leptotrichia sp. oral taxon 218]QUB95822.1 transcription termination/antitermination factor NusG [Leptotrichia sp. oral taxon 218]
MTEKNENENEIVYEKKWYIIHTYSGYEKKVATDLEKRIESLDLTDRVFRILVPEEEVLEEKRGKMVKVSRKLFPSYVMIEMLSVKEENELGLGYRVDSDAWYVIRNTNGVTGFVGVGSDPIPLSDEEAQELLAKVGIDIINGDTVEKGPRYNIDFKVGEKVIIKKDSFLDQEGEISAIDDINGKVTVMLEVFGRQTPVELEYTEIAKLDY